jgi:hypothetical protein
MKKAVSFWLNTREAGLGDQTCLFLIAIYPLKWRAGSSRETAELTNLAGGWFG